MKRDERLIEIAASMFMERGFEGTSIDAVAEAASVGITEEEHAYTIDLRLLRPRYDRPCRRRAAEKRDEPTPFHSITSSARASRDGGTVNPSAFAVLRLITSSYLVGACTGRSAGFSPLRMRST